MDDFFTLESFGTLSGSVAAVVVVTNTVRSVFNWGPAWFGLLLAVLVSFAACAITTAASDETFETSEAIVRFVIALVNGCLIYASAYGIQNNVIAKRGSSAKTDSRSAASAPMRLQWRSAWSCRR